MDKEGFILYLKKKGKDRGTPYYLRLLAVLEDYLNDHTGHKDLDKITAEELKDFIMKSKNNYQSYQYLRPIRDYYGFKENEEIEYLCNDYMGAISLETYKLSQFMGVDKDIITRLKKIGIVTAQQMLEKGATIEGRKKIAEETDIPAEKLLELSKLSNLARVPGHKAKRARLYLEAGIDTLEKMATLTAEELIKISEDYIQKSGFAGSAPIYGDANFSVENAKRLKDIVEF
ncbi:MAG: DUF4332 domain-containing protein [Asgard group archaeon]|nr:DUF4332 domain-containing protein [Asgard group archaeon]